MKMQSKPIIALASGSILLFGVLCQTTQAQSTLVDSGTAVLPAVDDLGFDSLTVDYSVYFTTPAIGSDYYTYDYTVYNPSSGNVADFNVGFDANAPDAVLPSSITGGNGPLPNQNVGGAGVNWYFETQTITQGNNSGMLSFESSFAPINDGNANASGGANPPGGWGTDPDDPTDGVVAVPNVPVVPEPATTTLFALTLLLLAFRPNILKRT